MVSCDILKNLRPAYRWELCSGMLRDACVLVDFLPKMETVSAAGYVHPQETATCASRKASESFATRLLTTSRRASDIVDNRRKRPGRAPVPTYSGSLEDYTRDRHYENDDEGTRS
jgi:hypothetical protein